MSDKGKSYYYVGVDGWDNHGNYQSFEGLHGFPSLSDARACLSNLRQYMSDHGIVCFNYQVLRGPNENHTVPVFDGMKYNYRSLDDIEKGADKFLASGPVSDVGCHVVTSWGYLDFGKPSQYHEPVAEVRR